MYLCVVIWVLLSEVSVEASDIRVSGRVGGSVRIECSHLFARGNKKYFCRDPCTADRHTLIRSGQSSTGRYRLENVRNGVFTVTITGLRKSDAGTYWCGVDRFLKDTYHKVLLTIRDAPSHHMYLPKATSTAVPVRLVRSGEPVTSPPTTIFHSTNLLISQTELPLQVSSPTTDLLHGLTGSILYTAAGLGALVIIIGLCLFASHRFKRTNIRSQCAGPCSVYAEVKKPHTANCQPNRSSATAESHEETLENPLYSTMEPEESLDSNIYSSAQ